MKGQARVSTILAFKNKKGSLAKERIGAKRQGQRLEMAFELLMSGLHKVREKTPDSQHAMQLILGLMG